MSDGLIFGRKRGEDSFYTPSRDILQIWPSCIVRGAAFAVDPESDIYTWLLQQDGMSSENVVDRVRDGLSEIMCILSECRSAPLSEALTQDRVHWGVFKAIMFGASIVAFNTYNKEFRQARLTTIQNGAIQEPTPQIDNEYCLRMFDRLVKQARGLIDG